MTDYKDYKKLCAELVEIWDNTSDPDYYDFGDAARHLVIRARDALAEPEPELEITHDGSSNKPTAKELQSLWQACNSPSVFARAVLARWGNHPGSPDSSTSQPVPVSERLPGPKDFDTDGRCWWFCPECPGENLYWILAREVYCNSTHWLPAHALPLPSHD